MEENCEITMKLEEKNNWQAWKNQGNRGKLLGKWRNCRKEHVGKGLKKRYEMEERQSFEKIRNIEASILKKLRIRSSTESSVRWGSEQDSLQGGEWYRGRSGKGLQSKDKCDKKRNMQASCFIFSCLRVFVFFPSGLTFQTANLDHSPTLPRHFFAEPKRFRLGAGFRPRFSGLPIYLSYLVLSCLFLSIYLSIYPSIYLSIYRSIHLSIYPSINLAIYPSIHLAI